VLMNKRRKFFSVALAPILVGCQPSREELAYASASTAQKRFRRLGAVLSVDSVRGAELLGVEFFADESKVAFYQSSVQALYNSSLLAFPGGILIPEFVRVVWHDSSEIISRDNGAITTYNGNIIGDYKVPIASRIPDSFIAALRKRGGALRLKFRLHPEGVLFGWDMELRVPMGNGQNMIQHEAPDGDFVEAYIYNGKAEKLGWYIHPKTKERVVTDF
jgi:hypothetical protein